MPEVIIESAIRIPAIEECRIESFAVPHRIYVCAHPDADDSFQVSAWGRTPRQAWGEMLTALYDHYCDDLPEGAFETFRQRITAARGWE